MFRADQTQNKNTAAGMPTQAQSELGDCAVESIQEMRQRMSELAEAVAARDTFIAVAAHELRNPMMPILGQLDLLLSAVKANKCSPDQIEQRLTRIQHTVRQYMKRAVVLLDVSRITCGNFRLEPCPCDLASLLRQIVDEFAAAAHHGGVTLTLDGPAVLLGWWDRLAVEQVVDNLISNAIKYGNRSPVELRVVASGERIEIHVRDHGKGIPREHRARVFERFERAVGKNEYRSGFGVGLWVVGKLVEAMNGSITIEDPAGGGALFIVRLPWIRTEGEAGD